MPGDYSPNVDRGEVMVTLDGVDYPMRPSWQAQAEIESALDGVSIDELRARLFALWSAAEGNPPSQGRIGLTLVQLATVVHRAIVAAGKDRDDGKLTRFNLERIKELVAQDRAGVSGQVVLLLSNMVHGRKAPQPGVTPDPKAPASPEQSSPGSSATP